VQANIVFWTEIEHSSYQVFDAASRRRVHPAYVWGGPSMPWT
jgi:hypothetical protein